MKHDEIDPKSPLWQLTVEEFMELQKKAIKSTQNPQYTYGLIGLANLLGCSRAKASAIKSSGILDEAIIQNGKIIIIDKEKALKLFNEK